LSRVLIVALLVLVPDLPKILDWGGCLTVTNTLAYFGTKLITAVRSFMSKDLQGPAL